MRRREILKGLSVTAANSFLFGRGGPILAQGAKDSGPLLAEPIRGLVRKEGTLLQPVQITFQDGVPGSVVVTRVDGEEVDRRTLSGGSETFQVLTVPVTQAKSSKITATVGAAEQQVVVTQKPVRKVLIYVLPHSHHDLGYTDVQPHIEEKQMNNISLALALAEKTSRYPVGARLVWNLEVLWSTDLFMQRKSEQEREALIEGIKQGWISVNGMYANELTGLCRPEELLQLFRYSKTLGRQCGVTVDSAMLSDVPGYTWGTIAAMAQAGIRYFSAAPNNADRIGTLRPVWHDRPFWHISPSGKERMLVWMPGHGYASWERGDAAMAAGCQDFLDSVDYPYEISYIRWSGHGDNAVPDPQICEFVQNWNQTYEWPKFSIASTSTAFAALENKYGKELPQFKGDLTPYWEDGAGSSALETRMNRNSADRLVQAEALAAMLSRSFAANLDPLEAWRNVLLYSEHTWGAARSIEEPDSPMTMSQWAIKRQFAIDGERQSKQLLEGAMQPKATGLKIAAVDIYNTCSWPRSEVVYLSKELSSAGNHVASSQGSAVPSQRLASGELAFLASNVSSFGCARYHLSDAKPHPPANPVVVHDGSVLDNGVLRARIDPSSGDLIELVFSGRAENLIDTSCGGSANQYLYVEGRDFKEVWERQRETKGLQYLDASLDGSDVGSVEKSGPARIDIEESGPLVASLRIESSAPGCNNLVRRVRLAAGADWLEISNLVDKKPAPKNPDFDDAATHGPWSQYGGKEAVHFAFPFAVRDGKVYIDIPLAEMQPEIDQFPGANKNWLPVGRWIDVANDELGVTWVTLDAPLVEIGQLSATLVGSNHNPLLWREHIAPTQKLYSWVMNNHWETNYCASQEGPVEFRYAIRPHRGFEPAAASRVALGLSQPLLPALAHSASPAASLLKIEPDDVLAVALKQSEDKKGLILRLFGASGETRRARLRWMSPRQVWLSDLSEERLTSIDGEIPVEGWGLVTVRAE